MYLGYLFSRQKAGCRVGGQGRYRVLFHFSLKPPRTPRHLSFSGFGVPVILGVGESTYPLCVPGSESQSLRTAAFAGKGAWTPCRHHTVGVHPGGGCVGTTRNVLAGTELNVQLQPNDVH